MRLNYNLNIVPLLIILFLSENELYGQGSGFLNVKTNLREPYERFASVPTSVMPDYYWYFWGLKKKLESPLIAEYLKKMDYQRYFNFFDSVCAYGTYDLLLPPLKSYKNSGMPALIHTGGFGYEVEIEGKKYFSSGTDAGNKGKVMLSSPVLPQREYYSPNGRPIGYEVRFRLMPGEYIENSLGEKDTAVVVTVFYTDTVHYTAKGKKRKIETIKYKLKYIWHLVEHLKRDPTIRLTYRLLWDKAAYNEISRRPYKKGDKEGVEYEIRWMGGCELFVEKIEVQDFNLWGQMDFITMKYRWVYDEIMAKIPKETVNKVERKFAESIKKSKLPEEVLRRYNIINSKPIED